MTVFNPSISDKKNPLFFGEPLSISRFDDPQYEVFDKLTKRQLGYFWRPEEIDVSKDIKDFRSLMEGEAHTFTSNIKRQIMLDSIQGRSPALVLLPVCSSLDLENWIITWSFSETIHSRSYSYIIQNVYPHPDQIIGSIQDIPEIQECAKDIASYYDAFSEIQKTEGDSKKSALVRLLYAISALEGIRFYVSFACSWAFTEQKKIMEGNAKIIKLIARDENLHLGAVQHMLKILQADSSYKKIFKDIEEEAIHIFDTVSKQEKQWAEYLFQHGAMIGLNAEMLKSYVDWLTAKRMSTVGLPAPSAGSNPLPWTQKWISGKEVQTAPQESELVNYVAGDVKQDVNSETFSGISL